MPGANSLRAIILAPNGRDGQVAGSLLSEAGLATIVAPDSASLLSHLAAGAGLAVIAEEALVNADLQPLGEWVADQPKWSDFPFIVLTRRSSASRSPLEVKLGAMLGNVAFVERPFHPASLVSLVSSAVRGRKRQYEARARIEELRRGQEELRYAQEAGQIGTFELDPATGRLNVSAAFCRIWGLSGRTNVALDELIALLDPEDRPKIRTNTAEPPADALDYIEYRIRRPDTGELRWIARKGDRFADGDGGGQRFFGVAYDITVRKNAEDALRESEARFRAIADSAPVPMWVTKLDRNREFVNRAYIEFLGVSYEEALTFDWRCVLHPEDLERVKSEQIEKEGWLRPFSLEARYRNASGEWRWLRSESQPRWDAAGQHTGFIGVAYDITIARRAAAELNSLNETLEAQVENRTQKLRQSEARFQGLFTASPEFLFLFRLTADDQLVYEDLNPVAETLYGRPRAEVIGRSPHGIVDADVAQAIETHCRECLRTGAELRYEAEREFRPGHKIILNIVVAPVAVPGEDGKLVLFCGRDLTEQRHAEEALRQSQKMEAVGQLTGGIAHDFNNLLTGIIGSLDLIKRRLASGRLEGLDRFMDAATASAQRAAALTHRLLAFARRQSLDTKPSNVNALVAGMDVVLRRTLGENIQCETILASELWHAMTDANQLESALLNLSINARDAMPDGGRLTIETANAQIGRDNVSADEDVTPGDYVVICVTDTGTGMPPAVLAKAFEPFFTTKPIGQGTGLGLSMIYGFAKQSGGFVRISSEQGRGTQVRLFLRRATGADERMPAAAKAATPRGDGEMVLIVEDDPSVRLLMSEVLEELGYRYMQVGEARAAIAIIESGTPIDLLVTDVGLPVLDGRQLADIARSHRPKIKVLFVTGYAEKAAVRSGFLAPGMEMIAKPFALDTLGSKIREIIRERDF